MARRINLLPNFSSKLALMLSAVDRMEPEQQDELRPVLLPLFEASKELDEFNRKIRDAVTSAADAIETLEGSVGAQSSDALLHWLM
jgi:hypothetical protein